MERFFRETKQEITFFSTKNLDFPAHIHEDVEMVFTRKGNGLVYCDGTPYHLTDRSCFLAFPNQVHHYVDTSAGDYILLIVKPSGQELLFKGRPLSSLCTTLDDHAVILLEMALAEYEKDGYTAVVAACLSAFFEKLLPLYEVEKSNASSNTVMRILQYCNEHYHEDITVSDIARTLHISKSAVSHIFSDRLGISFYDHIHTLRLGDAVRLLNNKQYSVTEVSELSGFPTIRTFNRVFLKQYGVSPSVYRKGLT